MVISLENEQKRLDKEHNSITFGAMKVKKVFAQG